MNSNRTDSEWKLSWTNTIQAKLTLDFWPDSCQNNLLLFCAQQ